MSKERTCKNCIYYDNDCPFTRGKFMPYPANGCDEYYTERPNANGVTKEEKAQLDDIFRKIKERDEFLSEKRRALAQLRKKMDESIATVWLLSLHEVSREWGEVTDEAWGVYLTDGEALNDLKYYRETECPDEDIIEDGAQYILRYEDYDGKYELKVAPVIVKGEAGEYSNRNIFEVEAAIIATNDGHIHAFTDRLPKGHKLKAGDMVAAIIKKKEAKR